MEIIFESLDILIAHKTRRMRTLENKTLLVVYKITTQGHQRSIPTEREWQMHADPKGRHTQQTILICIYQRRR